MIIRRTHSCHHAHILPCKLQRASCNTNELRVPNYLTDIEPYMHSCINRKHLRLKQTLLVSPILCFLDSLTHKHFMSTVHSHSTPPLLVGCQQQKTPLCTNGALEQARLQLFRTSQKTNTTRLHLHYSVYTFCCKLWRGSLIILTSHRVTLLWSVHDKRQDKISLTQ
jgi:hypothetical protein